MSRAAKNLIYRKLGKTYKHWLGGISAIKQGRKGIPKWPRDPNWNVDRGHYFDKQTKEFLKEAYGAYKSQRKVVQLSQQLARKKKKYGIK